MLHWMRRHMRIILIVTTIIVVPTFVVWGGYAKSSNKAKGGAVHEDAVIVTVGGTPITAREYTARLRDEANRAVQYGGEAKTMAQLRDDGTAERILNTMVDSVFLRIEADKLGVDFDQAYLVEMLKKDPSFQDKNGKFDPVLWNTWVASSEKQNWNEVYASVRAQLARTLLLQRVTAPARVLDSDIRKKFEENYTKIQVKYAAVDPEIVPTDEQIKAEYDKDPKRYDIPEKRDIQLACVSLTPPQPPLVDELITRIRNGENFGELAKQYSQGPEKDDGGVIGWLDVPASLEGDDLRVLFETPVGTVSAPLFLDGAYHIYTIDEEKTDPATGKRSVNARQIEIPAPLDEAERKARTDKAAQILAKAKEGGDLVAAATAAGLTVASATGVSRETEAVSGVAMADARTVIGKITGIAQDQISDVIAGSDGLYVVKVVKVDPPVPQPLDAVRDKVRENAINTIRRSPERRAELEKLGNDIAAKAKTLQDVVANSPELKIEIKESREFKRTDFMFNEDVYFQPSAVFDALIDKDPGAFAGPIKGMRGETYFVELVKKVPPTDEDWKESWPKEEKQLRENALMVRKNELLMDYIADLRERSMREISIQRDNVAIEKILSVGEETPEEEVPAAETPAETPAAPAAETPAAPAAETPATPAAAK